MRIRILNLRIHVGQRGRHGAANLSGIWLSRNALLSAPLPPLLLLRRGRRRVRRVEKDREEERYTVKVERGPAGRRQSAVGAEEECWRWRKSVEGLGQLWRGKATRSIREYILLREHLFPPCTRMRWRTIGGEARDRITR